MIRRSCMSATLLVAAIVLCFFSQKGDGIKCYVCNSANIYDPTDVCANLETQPEKAKHFIVDCAKETPRDGLPWERCRTVTQNVEGETRVVRSCATWPDKTKENTCIDRTGTSRARIRYCECNDKDLCNGVSFLKPSSLLFAFSALLGFYIYLH